MSQRKVKMQRWVKWEDVKNKLDLSKFKRGEIPTEEFKKEDIKKVDGSPNMILGDCYINGKDIDQYIIGVVVKDIRDNGVIAQAIREQLM